MSRLATHPPQIIRLTEYVDEYLEKNALPMEVGEEIWRKYDQSGGKILVDFPNPKTENRWRLTPQGWAGHIRLSSGLELLLEPKVKLNNLFRMLEYAFKLSSFHLMDGVVHAVSLKEFYEQLAHILSQRIINRGRRGFYHQYIQTVEPLPYVRGRFKLEQTWQKPGQLNLTCQFDEHTADFADNQIVLYTLDRILRSGLCRKEVQNSLRQAYRLLQSVATLRPFYPMDCSGRTYTRLNQDYQPLHALCRFFLQHSGPSHESGNQEMVPFLVNMAELYEMFVAEWLQTHLPPAYRLRSQERVAIDESGEYHFEIDLVLFHEENENPIAVLDTKYKIKDRLATDDIAQVVAYAQTVSSPKALLIYPTALQTPLESRVGNIDIRSLPFRLEGDLEASGQQFLEGLFSFVMD